MAKKSSAKSTEITLHASPIVSLEQVRIVQQYARISELKAEVKRLEAVARPAALMFAARGIMILDGIEGVVTMAERNGSRRLDVARVRELLGDKLDACYSVGDPTVEVEFLARVSPVKSCR